MATSPTQLSLRHLRQAGFTAAVVEHWQCFARIRQDLFGFADLLAFRDREIVLVQTTTASHVSDRIKKIEANENAALWLAAGHQIHVHGWLKSKSNRWEVRITVLGEQNPT